MFFDRDEHRHTGSRWCSPFTETRVRDDVRKSSQLIQVYTIVWLLKSFYFCIMTCHTVQPYEQENLFRPRPHQKGLFPEAFSGQNNFISNLLRRLYTVGRSLEILKHADVLESVQIGSSPFKFLLSIALSCYIKKPCPATSKAMMWMEDRKQDNTCPAP